jgi:uncharacterized protein
MKGIVQKVEAAVRKQLEGESTGHDWYHLKRVRDMALRLADKEGGDKTLIELAALVHDVGDHKFHASEEDGHKATFKLLADCNVPQSLADQIADIAHRVSFKGIGVADDMPTLEGKIVQDADRLDAIGAIAIARVFTYGGAKGRPIHDPEIPLVIPQNVDQYINSKSPSFHHFYEKLFHLKDRIHTKTAKVIAEKRHKFMEEYTEQFKREWDAKD